MGFVDSREWYLLKSNKFGFKIEFPQKPKATTHTINTEIGDLKMNLFICDLSNSENDNNLVYLANYSEYPRDLVNSDMKSSLKTFFRNSVDGAVSSVHGKLLKERVIDYKGYPGREFSVDYENGLAVIKMRMYLVKNKMYMIETISKKEYEFNTSIDRFMNSFELTKIK